MGLSSAYKAASIANAAESEIKRRATGAFLLNYNNQYAWGTEVGNHIFDTVAARSKKEKLSQADDFGLSLLYMLQQAQADESPGSVKGFQRILLEVLPYLRSELSIKVATEITHHLAATQLVADAEIEKAEDERRQAETLKKAGDDGRQAEALKKAEDKRRQAEAFAKAEDERRKEEALAKAEEERRKEEALEKLVPAHIAIEYNPVGPEVWAEIQLLPKSFQDMFLERLVENPQQNLRELEDAIKRKFNDFLNPYDDPAANNALDQARSISPEAEGEFVRVYELLGKSIEPSDIISRIEQKFGPTQTTKENEVRERKENEARERKEIEARQRKYKEAQERQVEKAREHQERRAKEREWREARQQEHNRRKKRQMWLFCYAGIFLLAWILFIN
ncbi:hypothetical protein N9N54_07620 [Planktomarina temperata]|nr:hypothetical protein [Planktomarina temperata]